MHNSCIIEPSLEMRCEDGIRNMESQSLTETEAPKEKVAYVTNLEGMILRGIINHRIGTRVCSVVLFSDFAQDFYGGKVACSPEQFPEMARRIAAAKAEYLKGNKKPLKDILDESLEKRMTPS